MCEVYLLLKIIILPHGQNREKKMLCEVFLLPYTKYNSQAKSCRKNICLKSFCCTKYTSRGIVQKNISVSLSAAQNILRAKNSFLKYVLIGMVGTTGLRSLQFENHFQHKRPRIFLFLLCVSQTSSKILFLLDYLKN